MITSSTNIITQRKKGRKKIPGGVKRSKESEKLRMREKVISVSSWDIPLLFRPASRGSSLQELLANVG